MGIDEDIKNLTGGRMLAVTHISPRHDLTVGPNGQPNRDNTWVPLTMR